MRVCNHPGRGITGPYGRLRRRPRRLARRLGGCVLSNAGTPVAALFLAGLWYRIAKKLARNPLTHFFSLVCAPLVLANAATTMDYLWSLAFLLATLNAPLDQRVIAAGGR